MDYCFLFKSEYLRTNKSGSQHACTRIVLVLSHKNRSPSTRLISPKIRACTEWNIPENIDGFEINTSKNLHRSKYVTINKPSLDQIISVYFKASDLSENSFSHVHATKTDSQSIPGPFRKSSLFRKCTINCADFDATLSMRSVGSGRNKCIIRVQ